MFFDDDNDKNHGDHDVHHGLALGVFTFFFASIIMLLVAIYPSYKVLLSPVPKQLLVGAVSEALIAKVNALILEANFPIPDGEVILKNCPWLSTQFSKPILSVAAKVGSTETQLEKKIAANNTKEGTNKSRIAQKQIREMESLTRQTDSLMSRAKDDMSKQTIASYKTAMSTAINAKKTSMDTAVTTYSESVNTLLKEAIDKNIDIAWQAYVVSAKGIIEDTVVACGAESISTPTASSLRSSVSRALSASAKQYSAGLKVIKNDLNSSLKDFYKTLTTSNREIQTKYREDVKTITTTLKASLKSVSDSAKLASDVPTTAENTVMVSGPVINNDPCYVEWNFSEEKVAWKSDINFDSKSFETFKEPAFPIFQYNAESGAPYYVSVLNSTGGTLGKYPLHSARFLISESFTASGITGSLIESPTAVNSILLPSFDGRIAGLKVYSYDNKLLQSLSFEPNLNCNPERNIPHSSIVSIMPVPKTVLKSAATFSWNAVEGATSYSFRIGKIVGKGDIKTVSLGTTRNIYVSGLPTDGSTLYVRILYTVGGTTKWQDFTYTAVGTASAPTNNL